MIGPFLSVSWCHLTRCCRCWTRRSGQPVQNMYFPRFDWSFSLCQLVSRDMLLPRLDLEEPAGRFKICISRVLIGPFLSVSWCHVTRCCRCWTRRSGRAGPPLSCTSASSAGGAWPPAITSSPTWRERTPTGTRPSSSRAGHFFYFVLVEELL